MLVAALVDSGASSVNTAYLIVSEAVDHVHDLAVTGAGTTAGEYTNGKPPPSRSAVPCPAARHGPFHALEDAHPRAKRDVARVRSGLARPGGERQPIPTCARP